MTPIMDPLKDIPEYTDPDHIDDSISTSHDFENKTLPTQHPFEGDKSAQKAYKKLKKMLDHKIDQLWRWHFNGKLPMSYAEVQDSLQPPLDLSPNKDVALTDSDQKVLQELGYQDAEQKQNKQQEMISLLDDLVAINSQTDDIAGNALVRQRLSEELKAIGFEITNYPDEGVTIASHHPENYQGDRVLLLGHTDTVLRQDTYPTPLSQKDGSIYGSGVADMKGGLVIMTTALKGLHDSGNLENRHITVVLNSDEEIGSAASKKIIRDLAKDHDVGLSFESGKDSNTHAGGGLTLGRKGIYALNIDIWGQSAHSGVAHYQGVDAGSVGTRIATYLSAMTDYENGVTVNVGVIQPNDQIARNRVIEKVLLKAEFRTWDLENREQLAQQAETIIYGAMQCSPYAKSGEELCTDVQIEERERPPAPVTQENKAWFEDIASLAEQIDYPVEAVTSGGASDQNILVNAGMTRVIDSWGPIGYGLHSPEEHLQFDSLLPRAQLVALTIEHTK